MERLADRGGRYISGANAGLFALLVRTSREMFASSLGFRPAFAPNVGSFMAMAMRTEQGAKGSLFRPRRRGNFSSPTRPVDNESGVGHFSLRWLRANREWPEDGAAGFSRRQLQ